ncbi:glycosyltransferase family 2 protein [Sphingomonas sp. 1P08PE]|uniref:glycosyltransferase family 2 protein n=1 Tax=Sphingomonas sp. 1P08PE TaxID=554122 RepID=UPI0039A3E881
MLDILCLVVTTPLLLVTSVFIVECWGGIVPARADGADFPIADPTDVVVLMPAHDEANGIAEVLTATRAGMPAGMRLLVIADNCTDDTASIVRSAGVEVIERHDTDRRGKGFALDFGRQALSFAPPACVVVVDADTVPQPGALKRLAARAISAGRPVQGAYTIEVAPADGSVARFSAAAFYVKNAVRQLGAARIGAPAVLTGSGMAFPWPVFADLPLATGHVAEDLMLGIESSLNDRAPLFEAKAVVLGTTSSDKGTAVQRRRWESGFFQVASDSAGGLLRRALTHGPLMSGWLGLHLLTPPLIPLLALDTALMLVLATVWLLIGVGGAALLLVGIATSMAVGGVILALAAHRRLGLLAGWHEIPKYVLWKLALSLAALIRREKTWIRTDRN